MTATCDVAIVGGGIMGCSVGYSLLATDPRLRVVVVERDPTYRRASTCLSLANVRVQFTLEENILISRYTMRVLERFAEQMASSGEAPDVTFRREGNLFLVDEQSRPATQAAMARQRDLGGEVAWWSPEEVERHYPPYHASGFSGATFGASDGYLDAHAFLMGYRNKARALGLSFREDEVTGILLRDGRAGGVRLAHEGDLAAGCVVNCAGAWAAQVAASAEVALPIAPTARQVFVLRPAVALKGPLPLTSLPSGLYFRTETGGLLLAGRSMDEDPVGFDLAWTERRFVDHLWPELARFVPSFDRLSVERGWAGLYAVNTFDGNALLGEWPELPGLYLANGFSGHGLQQAPAVGRYIAELITGTEPALDLSIFSPGRLLEDAPVREGALV